MHSQYPEHDTMQVHFRADLALDDGHVKHFERPREGRFLASDRKDTTILFGGLTEGVMYAILLGNAISPLISLVTQPRVFGAGRKS